MNTTTTTTTTTTIVITTNGVLAMFSTDVFSVHALREADLLVAAQARGHREVVHPSSAMQLRRRLTLLAASLNDRMRPQRDSRVATFGPLSSSLELFKGLRTEQLAEMKRYLSVTEVQPGHTLGRQGEPASGFVTVLEGHVGVTIDGVPHAVLDDGTHFGAIPLLDRPHSMNRATFTTMTPTRIAFAEPLEFREILDRFPVVAHRIYLMAQVRREFLADLAGAPHQAEAVEELTGNLNDYPAHLPA